MPFQALTYNSEANNFISNNNLSNYSLLIEEQGLDSFIYYFDFSLLICNSCKIGINPNYLKGHLSKHFSSYKGKEKANKVISFLSLISTSLKFKELASSLSLIISFINNQSKFFYFLELNLVSLYKCLNCNSLFLSEQNAKRHNSSEHITSNLKPSYIVIKGQTLEANRFLFEINSKDKNIDLESNLLSREASIISSFSSSPPLITSSNSLELAKQAFRANYNEKEKLVFKSRLNYKYSSKEKLSPFQIKTRYIEYITKYNIKDLVNLALPINEKEESNLVILDLYLQEVLYLSLEKTTFLNKNHLFILNSFSKNQRSRKPFKPLLNSSTRIRYFKFFSRFLTYFMRAFFKIRYENISYFKTTKQIDNLVNKLLALIDSKQEEEETSLASTNKLLKKKKKNINLTLSRDYISSKLQVQIREEESNSSISSLSENSLNSSSNSTSTISSSSSSSSSSSKSFNSNNSINSNNLDNSSKLELKEIQTINKSKDLVGLEIKETILELIIVLFKEEQDLNLFHSSINSFFATISIRAKDFTFKDTLELSQDYSKFIYSSQLIVNEFAFRKLFNNINLSLNNILESFFSKYFNNNASTALSEILNNRLYCFKVNKEVSTSTFISISPTIKETISYKKVTLSVDNLRNLFQKLISSTNILLEEDLLFNISKSKYKSINLEEYSKLEDRSLTTPFKCFRDLSPNISTTSSFLQEEIFNNSLLFSRFFIVTSNNILKLNIKEVKRYLRSYKQFKIYLLLLVYLTSGLPLRGTELVTLRYLNSYKDKREIFLDISSSLFLINLSYYKGQGLSDKKASNIRYLCPSVSQIFLLYIVLIDPFIEFLEISILSKKDLNKIKNLKPYLFLVNNSLLDSRDLSYSLSSFSNQVLGFKLNIQVYRQLIISIIKEFMLEKLNLDTLTLEEEQNSLSQLVASQSNHSLQVEDLNYARNSLIFSNTSSNLQFKYLSFCLRFFSYFKINSQDLNLNSYTSQLRIKDNLEKDSNLIIANSLAVKYTKIKNLEKDLNTRKHTRQVSSISSTTILPYKKVKTLELISLSSLDSTSNILSNILKDFFQDSNACFKSLEQELLIKSILLKVPYILAVLPTSIGKSLSYLLTSSLSTSKVTIVIIPLIGLKSDIARRAKDFNIPCSIYEIEKEFKNLTLVSIESIISDSFIFQVKELINSNSLDRIIIEESHLLLSARSYRSIMFRFKELLVLVAQFIFITGTLPLEFEMQLKEDFLLKDISIIRASCLKSNISYRVKTYISNKQSEQIREIESYIENFKAKEFLTSLDKVLIFCPSLKDIEEVASILNCSFYTSKLSNSEKEATLNSFFINQDPYYKTLVTSSALEEGIDYSNIRLVIYKDFAYSFLGFLQGSSRAGRDNLPSTSMFFTSSKKLELDSSNNSSYLEASQDKYLLSSYLKESVCRKRQISLYLDNKLLDSCDLNSTFCDLCFNRQTISSSQVARVIDSNKKVENKLVQIKSNLATAFNTCLYCFFLKGHSDIIEEEHTSFTCPLYKDLNSLASKAKKYIKSIKLEEDSCCFNCLFPTIICRFFKKTSTCYQPDFIFQFLALLHTKRDILDPSHSLIKCRLGVSFNGFLLYSVNKVFIQELNTEGIRAFIFLTI